MRLTVLALALLCSFPVAALAATPALPAPAHFFNDPDIGSGTLSPNGRYFATTARKNGTLQLTVIDLHGNEAKVLAGYKDFDVHSVAWINNDRLIYNVVDRSSAQNSSFGGLYAVDRNTSKVTTLIATPRDLGFRSESDFNNFPIHLMAVGVARANPRNLLALGRFADGEVRPYIVDSLNGKRTEVPLDLPGKGAYYLFDDKDQVRAALTLPTADAKTSVIWYRDGDAKPWRKLAEQTSLDAKLGLAGMDADHLYVTAPAGARDGLYRYDLANMRLGELVASDDSADIDGNLLFNQDRSKLIGVRIASEPPRTLWLDPELAALQAALDKRSPQTVNVIQPGEAGAARLIFAYAPTEPGRFSVWKPDTKRVEALVARMPWIEPASMSATVVLDYSARDGTPIQSYLTLPRGRGAKGLPLIVMPHGGPWTRDHWGFDPTVQFLASRGYAVLQPQFRGSTGLGRELFQKGFRQWGLGMQDDLSDGIKNLAGQGVVDPGRVCIMGASYGGYAAMMGLVRDPAQYRCGINLLGVTDLSNMLKNGRWQYDSAVNYSNKVLIADPDSMREQILATSPVKHAARIQAPVFMAYGEKDNRVPLVQGTSMRAALKDAGKVHEWMSFTDEEHGFARQENRLKLYTGIDQFLREHNPPD